MEGFPQKDVAKTVFDACIKDPLVDWGKRNPLIAGGISLLLAEGYLRLGNSVDDSVGIQPTPIYSISSNLSIIAGGSVSLSAAGSILNTQVSGGSVSLGVQYNSGNLSASISGTANISTGGSMSNTSVTSAGASLNVNYNF